MLVLWTVSVSSHLDYMVIGYVDLIVSLTLSPLGVFVICDGVSIGTITVIFRIYRYSSV